jgi:GNAT superfamily N-acetyltransferase
MTDRAVPVRRAEPGDLEVLTTLFDAYRRFYGQAGDMELARRFLGERLERRDSILLLTTNGQGFAQLFPSFSSALARRTYILNDLYVAHEARRCGVGAALLKAACDAALAEGAARLTLSTALDNFAAQALYERMGWQPDTAFKVYHLLL